MVISNVSSYSSLVFSSVSAFLFDNLVPFLSSAGYTRALDSSIHPTVHNVKRDSHLSRSQFTAYAVLIPVLVLLSGLFAGLTLGYMSLDETQLNVLSISGTPKQREYAEKIKPIRKDGHLLLVTLLLANMIVNETLPVIADPVLGGGIQSVVVSTALIVIFSEIIPQSLCTRHGLYIGAKMAGVVRVLLWTMGILAWPVAKLLEFVLGPHHGIIYRRTELKELIAMHSDLGQYGGDLKTDTVTIIGATLDLQEKVVRQAMTPIQDVFMLSIDTKLDYDTLRQICLTGHSRVPVYEEVAIPTSKVIEARNKAGAGVIPFTTQSEDGKTMIVKKIIGILLVKQCVLLDPGDSIPLRKIPLNKVPFVPNNEPLLGILDKFQEGRSHMAIVSRFSTDKAASVKKAVKQSLTQRLRHRVGISDDSSSDSGGEENGSSKSFSKGNKHQKGNKVQQEQDQEATLRGNGVWEDYDTAEDDESKRPFHLRSQKSGRRGKNMRRMNSAGGARGRNDDLEMGVMDTDARQRSKAASFTTLGLEQVTPADAVLAKEGVEDLLQILDPAIMPLGIITLEDVLEELIGEEIYDEFDPHHQGAQLSSYIPPESDEDNEKNRPDSVSLPTMNAHHPLVTNEGESKSLNTKPVLKPVASPALKGFNFLLSKNAPQAPKAPEWTEGVTGTEALSVEPAASGMHDASGEFMLPPQVELGDLSLPHTSPPPALPSSALADLPVRPEPALAKNRSMSETALAPAFATGNHSLPHNSTSTSPAPSLEAILLDRKRRGVTSSSSSSIASGRVIAPNLNKGKFGFKSSPLGGTERTGLIIAEAVKKGTKVSDAVDDSVQEKKFYT